MKYLCLPHFWHCNGASMIEGHSKPLGCWWMVAWFNGHYSKGRSWVACCRSVVWGNDEAVKMSRKISTRIAFIPATFYSVSLLLSSLPGSQKEVWQGDREVLRHLRKTLEFVFQKERISATGGKKLLVSRIKGLIFMWCCGYVRVTLCQKILDLKEMLETRSLIWCLKPGLPLYFPTQTTSFVGAQPVSGEGTYCWSRSPTSFLGRINY